ncbi:MAG: Microcin C7 self-immunity protein MccF [Firmicutes bacterium ADurb.Bin182]|nr:MAG: Microcin C7 self-immunity protein MccF [Firmicutes bacterium ADurb.Bin182]
MLDLIKPPKLKYGDTVAAVSLSWGGAGDPELLWRYEAGKKRLLEEFGLKLVEMPNTLKGSEYIYLHPEKRAQDLMQAFEDKNIKGIISCIGGEESIRLLPYVDFSMIRANPKVFIGYSDSTVTHFMCMKAGVSSFYGAAVLGEFAENVQMFDYTKAHILKTLFEDKPLGRLDPAPGWTGERLEWTFENRNTMKKLLPNRGHELLSGKGTARGRLIGGCIEVLEMMKDTLLWPSHSAFDDAILFLETSEDTPEPSYIEYWLRNYGSSGILKRLSGMIWGKPYQEKYYEEYKMSILKIVKNELDLNLPVLYNLSFGHNQPMLCLPYGALAEICCEECSLTVLEPGVC